MGYYNRKEQTLFTFDTINKSKIANLIEVIIADDGSNADHDLSILLNNGKYKFTIKLYKLQEEKNWSNPVIAYNLAISKIHTSSEWIIIQNPEVCHIRDIPSYIISNGNPEYYYAFNVFACESETVNQTLRSLDYDNISVNKLRGEWYCHEIYRPRAYHFCTAIHRSKLEKIGGFNPNMKDGINYDDDEMLTRIERVCKIKYINEPYAIHQWHPHYFYAYPDLDLRSNKNAILYHRVKDNNSIINVNISDFLPKTQEFIYNPQ